MAKPVAHTFKVSKKRITELLPTIIRSEKMQFMGCHKRLGLISFRQRSGAMLYAHIVESKNGITQVSIGPGLSYLGERDPSEVPRTTIGHMMDKLDNAIKNDNKSHKSA